MLSRQNESDIIDIDAAWCANSKSPKMWVTRSFCVDYHMLNSTTKQIEICLV